MQYRPNGGDWSDVTQLIAPGDVTGDGLPDVITREGDLLLQRRAVLSLGPGSVRFMPNRWTASQVLALAPDASSRQAAVRLAGAAR
jgi:hypothetical protein